MFCLDVDELLTGLKPSSHTQKRRPIYFPSLERGKRLVFLPASSPYELESTVIGTLVEQWRSSVKRVGLGVDVLHVGLVDQRKAEKVGPSRDKWTVINAMKCAVDINKHTSKSE